MIGEQGRGVVFPLAYQRSRMTCLYVCVCMFVVVVFCVRVCVDVFSNLLPSLSRSALLWGKGNYVCLKLLRTENHIKLN